MPQEINYDLLPAELAMKFIRDSQHNSYFKKFFFGNPEDNEIGEAELPALFFIKENNAYSLDATNADAVKSVILIRAVINRRSFNSDPDADTAVDFKKLELMIEGTVNGVLDPNSILGILRSNFTMNGWVVDNDIEINYGGVRDLFADEITREAQIKMTINRIQQSFKT